MRHVTVVFIVIFLGLWGIGLMTSFLYGAKKLNAPLPRSEISGSSTQKDQQRFVQESNDSYQRMMQDNKRSVEQFKQNNPSTGGQQSYRQTMDDLKYQMRRLKDTH